MSGKLKSRKFWLTIVGEAASAVALIYGITAGEVVAIIGGAVVSALVTLGYLKVEGDIDKARVTASQEGK